MTAGAGADEIKLRHINDLWSLSPSYDDRYTGTVTLAWTHEGWTIDVTEYMFTDKDINELRFDETYFTVAREFTPGEGHWRLRARAGVAHVGKGIFGERFQNFVHRLLDQSELDLPYVRDGSHMFASVHASRPVVERERFTLTPYGEIESAGFKRHVLLALTANWDVGKGYGIVAETGFRWTRTDFAPLGFWIDENDPTFAVGASYKHLIDVRWTQNYFGTGERHWHLTTRIRIDKKDAD